MLRPLLDIYILSATGFCLAGWGLSLLGYLTPLGYLAASFCIAFSVLFYLKRYFPSVWTPSTWRGWRWRRFRRWLPGSFLILAVLILWGGVGHEPNNHDGLSYRVPRVLHWLDHGSWYWTGNFDERMDTRSAGFEWLSAPFLALLKTDRPIFLWNWLGFLVFPSLVFQLCRKIGAGGRAAWTWMWLVPTAHGVVLQAGGIGNDFIGAVLFFASLNLVAARGPATRRNMVLSGLAISLCAGIKSSNLLWVLPWALLVTTTRHGWKLPLSWLAPLLVVFMLNASLPIFVSNHLHGGNWSGANLENSEEKPVMADNPWLGIAGNCILLVLQNCSPPFWPYIKETVVGIREVLPPAVVAGLSKTFEGGFLDLGIRELPGEEGAGLGLALMLCIFFSLGYAMCSNKSKPRMACSFLFAGGGTWVAILVYSSLLAMACPARILLPGLLFLVLFASALPGQDVWARSTASRVLFLFTVSSACAVLLVNPSRPLLPVPALLQAAERIGLPNSWQQRMKSVYSTYAQRARVFEPLLAKIPIGQRNQSLGYAGGAGLEASLWKPYGTRAVISLNLAEYEGTSVRSLPSFVVTPLRHIPQFTTPQDRGWIQTRKAEVLADEEILFQARFSPERFFLLRFPSCSTAPTPQ